jgi:hypothetical protein
LHIPFSLRHLVKNQRFSVSGQPMLYMGSSIITIAKELETEIDELAIAAFLPKDRAHLESKIFNLDNHIGRTLLDMLTIALVYKSQNYSALECSPQDKHVLEDVHNAIFINICTFPKKENNHSFIPEYVIPQTLTTSLLENGYKGISYPSTKDFSDISGYTRFSGHHINYCVFVPYDGENEYSKELLNKYDCFIIDMQEPLSASLEKVENKVAEIININKINNKNNIYIFAIGNLRRYIDELKRAKIEDRKYFSTKIGQLELAFFMKMLSIIEEKIRKTV